MFAFGFVFSCGEFWIELVANSLIGRSYLCESRPFVVIWRDRRCRRFSCCRVVYMFMFVVSWVFVLFLGCTPLLFLSICVAPLPNLWIVVGRVCWRVRCSCLLL